MNSKKIGLVGPIGIKGYECRVYGQKDGGAQVLVLFLVLLFVDE